MRVIEKKQLQLGEIDIAKIKLDLKSRDDIPQLLRGLQHIYTSPSLRCEVFKILDEMIPKKVNKKNGRPGMDIWKIFVLGVLRVNLDWDFDRTQEMANNHRTIRQMLGHSDIDNGGEYKLQTLRDNISLFSPEILDRVNEVVVKAGHSIVKKKDENLKGRCDSSVVKTDVHYPTDINLLFDAIRKVITIIAAVCANNSVSDWRQSSHNLRKIKRLFRKAQQMKGSTSKDDKKKQEREQLIKEAHQVYFEVVSGFLNKTEKTVEKLIAKKQISLISHGNILTYMTHAKRQIDQINRRVIQGEKIPHDEKVFSIFEEHTEWICKGKAGVPVELGLRVCILEDQYGFILHHHIMQKQTDDQIAVSMVTEAKKKYPSLSQCSFDKGFHSPANQGKLAQLLDRVVLPKKGKLSKERREIEHEEEFIKARRQHSAVESGINALQVHGLKRCLDQGLNGFKRYVGMAVVGRNIQKLGAALREVEAKETERSRKAA